MPRSSEFNKRQIEWVFGREVRIRGAQAMTGPRFEQTIMELQVRGVSSTLRILMKEKSFY
jgi:hypothetical protein